MKQLLTFIKKEFHHILRDTRSLLVLLALPIVQLLIFGFAITNEIRNSNIAILDNAKDETTQKIITKIENSKYFDIDRTLTTNNQIEEAFKSGKIKLAVVFQTNFQNVLAHTNKAQVQIIADATDPNQATTLANYANAIIMDYQNDLNETNKPPYTISAEIRMLYNPELKGAYSSVPGVMGMILLLISTMMTSISIVKEKELGTMEILLVSPIKPLMIILSKVVPYFVISLVNIATILLLSVFVLGMPIQGSLFLLIVVTVLYLICALSLGILISTVTESQLAAMLLSLLGLMLPVVMLSGYAFPIANMPVVLQALSNIVPAKWYIILVKSVMIKGLGLSAIWNEVLILTAMTIFFLFVSLKRFKIRLQ
ncbi:MAG: antibiotic transport system permease protein [Ignavibacteria bacterium]|nr:MAG: antibiotic transport system permease protein [Ignavibacteria bacterium]KAF0161613.1 MAG: antibiotic transport system permease protein [Ignavibacteria bacterium]